MVRRRIVRRSGPFSARVLRYVYDCLYGTLTSSQADTDHAIIVAAADIPGVRRVRGFP
jgi:hypothetical protein